MNVKPTFFFYLSCNNVAQTDRGLTLECHGLQCQSCILSPHLSILHQSPQGADFLTFASCNTTLSELSLMSCNSSINVLFTNENTIDHRVTIAHYFTKSVFNSIVFNSLYCHKIGYLSYILSRVPEIKYSRY